MHKRKNPFISFAVLSLLVTIFVGLLLGEMLFDKSSDRLVKTHLRLFPETVRNTFDNHRETVPWFSQSPGGTLPVPVAKLTQGLLKIPGVFRIKIWNTDGTIIWSDQTELIGQNFSQNQHFQIASRGTVSYNNTGFRKPENQTEQNEQIIVEVYAPVYDGDRVIGVMELYESDKVLSTLILNSAKTTWTSLALAGAGLYLLMIAVYLLTHDVVAQFSQKRRAE